MNPTPPIIKQIPGLVYGADYNPEQWIKSRDILWDEDIRLAKLAGLNSLTVGVFSWAMLEPAEGIYDFEWLDEVMDKLAKAGITAILATPTASRPPWMAQQYPEVLRTKMDRHQNQYGDRHNHCLTSPVYREKAQVLNTLLAQRYAGHPALGMWHVSNELSGSCHCPLCQAAFRDWLQNRYGTLDALNEAWWNTFWSHRYTDWEQIQSPSKTGQSRKPGLWVDWWRFATDQTIRFVQSEMEPLRRLTPEVPCTTNLMAAYDELDYVKLAAEFDVVSWDAYPNWAAQNDRDIATARRYAYFHDMMYGLKRQPFLLMESAPSSANGQYHMKLYRPGGLLLQSAMAVAHGADSVQYFQLRKSRGGTEQHHGAVVDHTGNENTRVFREVKAVGAFLAGIPEVAGTVKPSQVAVIWDYENHWAINNTELGHCEGNGYQQTVIDHYGVFWEKGVPVDIIDSTASMDRYRLVVAPMLYMLRPGFAQRADAFVRAGGILVATYFTGYTDEQTLCFSEGFPGPLKATFGIWNEELDSLFPEDRNTLEWNGQAYEVFDFCERIHPQGAEVLGTYGSDFYAGEAALTRNVCGDGSAYYIAARTGPDFLRDLYTTLMEEAKVVPPLRQTPPEGVSVQLRTDGKEDHLFLLNYTGQEKVVDVDTEAVTLPPRGVRVLRRPAGE